MYLIFNICYLQYYSFDYKDFLNEITDNDTPNPNIENKKIKDELKNYKRENEQLKIKINKLIDDNNKLNNELIQAKKIISDNAKNNQNGNNNIIKDLNDMLKRKDKEINELKIKLNSVNKEEKLVNLNDVLYIHFISVDQKINCPIRCLKTDTFAEVEEKLYQKYEDYRETNNNFVAKGGVILRFKKIYENNIEDGDKIELIMIE